MWASEVNFSTLHEAKTWNVKVLYNNFQCLSFTTEMLFQSSWKDSQQSESVEEESEENVNSASYVVGDVKRKIERIKMSK